MRTITLYKVLNLIKVSVSFQLSILLKKPLNWGLPITLSIEPTNSCNLHCPQCPSGNGNLTRKKEQIKPELFTKIIEEVNKHLLYLTFYFQGEPFLHPNYTSLIAEAHKQNIYTASSTNAQLINDKLAMETVNSGLNKLIISIDGTTQEVYEMYRVGGKLENTIQAIKSLTYWKKKLKSKTPNLEIQFIVLKHNEHQIPEIEKLSKDLCINKLALKTAQLENTETGKKLLPTNNTYSRYSIEKDGNLKRKKVVKNKCWRAFTGAVIAANGDVLPCSYDKNGEHAFGNINTEPLAKIWKNKKAMAFRKQLLLNRSQFDMCCNCTE